MTKRPAATDPRRPTQLLTQLEFNENDHVRAEALAVRLGYEQYAYTSTSDLWGLFCLPESPEHISGRRHADGGWITRPHPKARAHGGCIIKTHELGLMFVQDLEDLGASDLKEVSA